MEALIIRDIAWFRERVQAVARPDSHGLCQRVVRNE
jgi:hypothetical protein